MVGVPSKLNRYKRAGTKAVDNNDDDDDDEGASDGDGDGKTAATAMDTSLEDGEGDVGGGTGLTLIKIRLFKEAKKDEASVRACSTLGCCRGCTVLSLFPHDLPHRCPFSCSC